MPFLGVDLAIIDPSGKVLLTKREDFEVWCLPGGGVDDGESAAQAAIREAREETGLDVELTSLVGVYSLPYGPRGGSHILLFSARPVGGALQLAPGETVDIGYFDPGALPEPLFFDQSHMIEDAIRGIGGSAARRLGLVWPFDASMTRWDIYAMRDASGLTRQAFYQTYFGQAKQNGDLLEVAGNLAKEPSDDQYG